MKQIVGDMPVYLTFDIDCLDPAFAPGTGTPVIGGLTSDRAIKLVRGLKDLNIVGMDVVEVAQAYDQSASKSSAWLNFLHSPLSGTRDLSFKTYPVN